MQPKLVPNAGRVLKRSLSLRMIEAFVAITLLDLAASLAPAIAGYLPFNPVWLLGAAPMHVACVVDCQLQSAGR